MAARKKTAENAENTVEITVSEKARTYDKKQLIKSQRFAENNLAARAALKDGVKYTLEEAEKAVNDFLSK